MSRTIYALAKEAGVNPQSLYMQARTIGANGKPYLIASRRKCDACGHTAWMVDDDEAERYLKRRAARLASQ